MKWNRAQFVSYDCKVSKVGSLRSTTTSTELEMTFYFSSHFLNHSHRLAIYSSQSAHINWITFSHFHFLQRVARVFMTTRWWDFFSGPDSVRWKRDFISIGLSLKRIQMQTSCQTSNERSRILIMQKEAQIENKFHRFMLVFHLKVWIKITNFYFVFR